MAAMADLCRKLRRLSSTRRLGPELPNPLFSIPRCRLQPSASSPNRAPSGSIAFSHVKLLKPKADHFRFYYAGGGLRPLRPNLHRREMKRVMDLIRSGSDDLRAKLDSLDVRLPVSSVVRILQAMNGEKIPSLAFYDWLRASCPDHVRDIDVCSLIIDNCGRLEDFSAMFLILIEFKLNGFCLNKKAFGFLNVLSSSKTSVKDSVRNTMNVLKEVGGSCLDSGIRSLVEMFGSSGSVALAKFVIQISEEKVSFYNVLVKQMCNNCDFQEVKRLLSEMRQSGCNPNQFTYNYFISSLCQNNEIMEAREMLKEMQSWDCPPNALTYEILICYHLRRTGEMDIALELFNQMVQMGIEPRLNTNAAFLKAYFNTQRYEDAYKFVISSCPRSHMNVSYSLLASLLEKGGNHVESQKVLVEMMEKGLRPNFSVYKRVVRHLVMSGETELAQDLTKRSNKVPVLKLDFASG